MTFDSNQNQIRKISLMNKNELNLAIKSFDAKRYSDIIKPTESYREDFVKRFPINRIRKMKLDEYVIGKNIKEDNFCYELERKLAPLGKILGAQSSKFGIYYSKEHKRYQVSKMWDSGNLNNSFSALKEELASLINAGAKDNIAAIKTSKISPMFKGKILSTYFPEKYLNIFSEKHLDYFIQTLNLDHKAKGKDIFGKREVLLEFKKNDSTMSTWPLHTFTHFLYTEYPGRPKADEKGDYFQGAKMIYGDFTSNNTPSHKPTKGKTDYDTRNKAQQKLGERGEYVVLQFEKERLQQWGARKTPQQVSIKNDSLGYDILSYSKANKKIQIEVKSTNLSPKDFHFYFTHNELEAAHRFKSSYHVYIVFNPNNATPKILDMGNPFIKKNKIKLIPIVYKINIHKK